MGVIFGGEPPCCKHLLPICPVSGRAFSGPLFVAGGFVFFFIERGRVTLWRGSRAHKAVLKPYQHLPTEWGEQTLVGWEREEQLSV